MEEQSEYITDALEMMGIVQHKKIETQISGWIPVFDYVIDFYQDHITALVFGRRWQYCGMEDGVCRASLAKIAKDLHMDEATVMRHTEKLVKDHFLIDKTPDRRNRPHVYVDGGKVTMKNAINAHIAQSNTTIAQSNVGIAESKLIKQDNTSIKNISLSQADYDQCNVKSDYIINASKVQTWQGRELIRDNLVHFADWYNKVTGQVMTKRVQKSWWKALQDWQDEQLSTTDLQTAFDAQTKWRMVSDPNQLTKDACAVKASANAVLDESEYTRLL